jgi:PhoPQ-activated pathogenicity-related protein
MMDNNNNYDQNLHSELLESFANFLQSYSKLLDVAEKYQQNVTFAKLIDNTDVSVQKYILTDQLVNTLTNMVPYFMQFHQLEDSLESLTK